MEKLLLNSHAKSGKHPEEGSSSGLILESGNLPPRFGSTNPHHPDDSLFSLPKVKLPVFDGTDPRGWITKAELYFSIHQTTEPNKLKLSQMCMEGTTLNWFTTLFFKHCQTTWNDFKSKLLVLFGETRYLNAHEALGSLLQEGDIEDYIKQFESISALIPEQSEASALGMFLCGLQLDIRNWVRGLRPTTCDQAMEMARHVTTATTTGDDNSTFTKKTHLV